jgi:hypothetical protein
MREPETGSERLREGLGALKRELGAIASVRPDVERRIAAVRMRPGLPVWPVATVSVALVLGLATLWWRTGGDGDARKPTRVVQIEPPAGLAAEPLRLTVNDTEVVAHVSAVVDGRAVLVAWSVRGGDETGGPAEQRDSRTGKYRHRQLPSGKLPDGRRVACSVYVPDAGVHPVLEPPTIIARGRADDVIAFSAAPRVAGDAQLSASLRSLGLDERVGVSMTGIRQSIRELAEE